MPQLTKKVAIQRTIAKISQWLSGSGDPEINDGIDVVDFLSQVVSSEEGRDKFSQDMQHFEKRLQALAPERASLWEATMQQVPPPSKETEMCCLAPWHLGVEARHRCTGKAKSVRVLEVVVELMERPMDTRSSPLQIELHALTVGSGLTPFCISYFQGFTRALAVVTLIRAMMEFTDEELMPLLTEACALMRINAVIMPEAPIATRIADSISAKMSVTERLRPDPIQIFSAISALFKLQTLTCDHR